MAVGYKTMLEEAEREIVTLAPADALALHGAEGVVFVDIRDPRELEREGRIPGSLHAPRGMLEFWIDPESPYHKPAFAERKRFVFYCAGGWRSALAAQTAQRMGMTDVAHVGGGLAAWREAGGAVEPVAPKPPREGTQAPGSKPGGRAPEPKPGG